jgi:hypothetical protein
VILATGTKPTTTKIAEETMKAYGEKKTRVPSRFGGDEHVGGRRRTCAGCNPETKNGRAKARAEGKAEAAEGRE